MAPALQARGLPQTKTVTTPGHSMGPSFKLTHKPDLNFLKSETYI